MNWATLQRSCLTWLVAALALRAALNVAVTNDGFSAISDDDFARVAIAQSFSHAPRWDPSGTSWLPFSFWLTGGVMRLTEASWEVAKCVAWGTSLGSVALFWFCGRAVGLRRHWLGLATFGFAALPHAVWLGLAPVPEGYSAVLALSGVCTARREARREGSGLGPGWAWLGVLSLLAATLSRYETWPLALVAASYHAAAARRTNLWRAGGLTLLSLGGPVAWCAHGLLHHGDALFFVGRVANYRQALGGAPETWLAVVGNYPRALFGQEPELWVVCAVLTLLALVRRYKRGTGAPELVHRPLAWAGAAVLLFLIWGDVTNGAPTHHPERALLSVWLGVWLLVLRLSQEVNDGAPGEPPDLERAPSAAPPRTVDAQWHVALAGAIVGATLASGLLRRDEQHFADRTHELTVGSRWGAGLAETRRGFVETPDYGYLAVSVGTRRPWLVTGHTEADPRQRGKAPPWDEPGALRVYFEQRRVGSVLVPRARSAALGAIGMAKREFDSLVLFELGH